MKLYYLRKLFDLSVHIGPVSALDSISAASNSAQRAWVFAF